MLSSNLLRGLKGAKLLQKLFFPLSLKGESKRGEASLI
jgi:hypothetical protein